jgi:hypothetical protein
VEAMLRTYGKPQADADEGSSGTRRPQKIKELYTVYEKRRKDVRRKRKVKPQQTAYDYAAQLRGLPPGYLYDLPVGEFCAYDRLCTIMDFSIETATGKVETTQSAPYPVERLLNGKDEVFQNDHPDSIRWIHLPANNMAWVRYERHFLYHIKFTWLISQTLMKRYYVGKGGSASSGDIEEDATTMQAQILYRGWWDKKQRCNRRGLEHARFMQPSCKKIIIGRLTSKR